MQPHQVIDEGGRVARVLELCRTGAARALDLSANGRGLPEWPFTDCERVEVRVASLCNLPFPDSSIDAVICIDTLELLNPRDLGAACREMARVARHAVVVGVPYLQDIRVGRATCGRCGTINPPYGHRSVFNEKRLRALFSPTLKWDRAIYSGEYHWATNPISVALMDLAGNPFGSYEQDEPCIGCGHRLQRPAKERGLAQKLATRGAMLLNRLQAMRPRSHPKYIDVRLRKAR